MPARSLDQIANLARRRGFIFPGSDIYGGLANSWDYGPLGVELKNNIRQEWWQWFVHRRPDIVGLDPAVIMNPQVWEASGHLEKFSDPLVECRKCHRRFRADGLDAAEPCTSGAHEFAPAKQFNLMFKSFLGPAEESASVVYLRAELAQAMFVNVPHVVETVRPRLPFGIAAQGRVFRNEITPGNYIFRTREFDLMELEYFVHPSEWERWFAYWQDQMLAWLTHVGVGAERLHVQEIPERERAHYSKKTVDIEYDYPFGRKELYGLAYRGDFDLKNHAAESGRDLSYTDPDTQEKLLPHVIEPTFGLDRTVLVALLEAYDEEDVKGETRTVLRFPAWMAPYKAAVLPLSKHDDLVPLAKGVYEELLQTVPCDYDETQSIGRRYRRQDEIGTPYCVTVDFDSLNDRAVTIRARDSMRQERTPMSELPGRLRALLAA